MEKTHHDLRSPMQRMFCLFLIAALAVPLFFCSSVSAAGTQSDLIGGENSGLINILLIGQDSREENVPARADCIILCSFCPDARAVTAVSFLRDLYVPIPGHEDNRLNAAYALGGMELLKQTLQDNFNLYIDGCIEADFSHFSKIIDLLGGVAIDLRQDEADAINEAIPGNLKEGAAQLNGEQALAYSRIRNLDPDGDFSRTRRQRKLLFALLESYRDAGLLTILSVVADVIPMLSSDLDHREILILAAKLFPLLDQPEVSSWRIPESGSFEYRTIRDMAVLTTNLEEVRKTLREKLLSSGSQGS